MAVVRSGAMMTDNLFHLSSFWELRHTPGALEEFLSRTQFRPGIEDAPPGERDDQQSDTKAGSSRADGGRIQSRTKRA